MFADAVFRLIVNGLDLVANVTELTVDSNLTVCQKVDRVTKIALNTLAIGSASSTVLDASPEVQIGFAATELMGNVLAIPMSVFSFAGEIEQRGSCTWNEVSRFIELIGVRGLRAMRLLCEAGCIEEKKYLAKSDKEGAKATRPVYTVEGGGDDIRYVYAGERPVDRAECERILSSLTPTARAIGLAEDAGNCKIFSNLSSAVVSVATSLVAAAASFADNQQEVHRATREREHRLPFEERETIPEEFEDDEILSQYKCPITQAPIRHPVLDPVSGTMYERAAIEEWVDLQHTSPLTRRPLERADLVPARDVQGIIDNRLRELQAERAAMEQEIHDDLNRRQQELVQEAEAISVVASAPVPEQAVAGSGALEQPRADDVVAEQPAGAGTIPPDQVQEEGANHERNGGEEVNQPLQDRLAIARHRVDYFESQGSAAE